MSQLKGKAQHTLLAKKKKKKRFQTGTNTQVVCIQIKMSGMSNDETKNSLFPLEHGTSVQITWVQWDIKLASFHS